MKFPVLFVLVLLACMYLTQAQGSYGNCCLNHVQGLKKNMKRNIKSYRFQETDGDCNMRAVVFYLRKKGKTACANPDHDWVKRLMHEVDRRHNAK